MNRQSFFGLLFMTLGALLLFVVFALVLFPQPIPDEAQWRAAANEGGPALSPYLPTTAPPVKARVASELIAVEEGVQELATEQTLLPESPADTSEEASVEVINTEAGQPAAGMPLRLEIPELALDVAVNPVGLEKRIEGKRAYGQWSVPQDFAAGWHDSSAPPGQPGNTVLNGHNNIYGAVFGNLVDLALGSRIVLHSEQGSFVYEITGREFLLERGATLRERLQNARWIEPTEDERLTLVTCWPNSSNSHRLVVVAQPVDG